MMRSLMLLLMLVGWPAFAHQTSNGYLDLVVEEGRLDVTAELALVDLQAMLDLDQDGDGAVRWGELRSQAASIDAHVANALTLSTREGVCRLEAGELSLNRRDGTLYVVHELSGDCDISDGGRLHYGTFDGFDTGHRAFVTWRDGAHVSSAVLAPGQELELGQARGLDVLGSFVVEGVHHILSGYDHLLFLFALLIPAAGRWRQSILIVTSFTVAHSITLILVALGLVDLPGRLVESLIALSVVVAASSIVRPFLVGWTPLVVFAFGLVHGLGFASAVASALPESGLVWALLGFNLGIEAGQLAVVLFVLPLLVLLRRFAFYPRFVMPAGAACLMLAGGVWFLDRALDIDLMAALVTTELSS